MKIKTKYNTGDKVIIDSDYGLTLASVEGMEIIISHYLKPKTLIKYKLCMVKEGVFIDILSTGENILCKATKRNIRKWESENE